MEFSKRMDQFKPGIFASLLAQKNQRLADGKLVIDLSVGSPNVPPAPHIMKTISEACLVGENYKYALSDTKELLEAAALWYKRRYGITLDPQTEICSLLGSQEGLGHIALTAINEGDVVLVPDPCYPVFADGQKLAGANLHYMPQRPENGYIIDLDEIPKDIARKAKFMIVAYPNNPTAVLAPDSFYEKLIAFAKENEIIVLHDNAYSELTFDGRSCGSFLRFEGAKEVGVEFNSLSKTYGLAGARVGFCLGNREVVAKMKLLKSNIDFGMFFPIQQGAIAAITGDQSCVNETRMAYELRRNVLCDGLTEIGWNVERCPATMFVWAKTPSKFTDSTQFALQLAEKTGLLVTPGAAFGPSGEGHVRMAMVQEPELLKLGIANLKASALLDL